VLTLPSPTGSDDVRVRREAIVDATAVHTLRR
jgi:hypothetical protein